MEPMFRYTYLIEKVQNIHLRSREVGLKELKLAHLKNEVTEVSNSDRARPYIAFIT